jgi:hypothetical protein
MHDELFVVFGAFEELPTLQGSGGKWDRFRQERHSGLS